MRTAEELKEYCKLMLQTAKDLDTPSSIKDYNDGIIKAFEMILCYMGE